VEVDGAVTHHAGSRINNSAAPDIHPLNGRARKLDHRFRGRRRPCPARSPSLRKKAIPRRPGLRDAKHRELRECSHTCPPRPAVNCGQIFMNLMTSDHSKLWQAFVRDAASAPVRARSAQSRCERRSRKAQAAWRRDAANPQAKIIKTDAPGRKAYAIAIPDRSTFAAPRKHGQLAFGYPGHRDLDVLWEMAPKRRIRPLPADVQRHGVRGACTK